MDAFKKYLKGLIDFLNKQLSWIDNHIPAIIRPLIPGVIGGLVRFRDVLELIYYCIADGGNPDQLRQAAQILQKYASQLTQFSNNTVTVSRLSATDPNVWTDMNASTVYIQRVQDLAGYFADAETWSQAIATGLNGDADVIDTFYTNLQKAIISILFDLAGVVSALVTLIIEVSSVVGAVASPASIIELVVSVIELEASFGDVENLRALQAPTISPTAEGHTWPVPVLW